MVVLISGISFVGYVLMRVRAGAASTVTANLSKQVSTRPRRRLRARGRRRARATLQALIALRSTAFLPWR
jgi:uncharacterized membrane protein (DUF4010 family)